MVSLDADESPSEGEIQKLQQQINRQFAINDYKGAVPACEELCAKVAARYSELHDECASPYYQYATALLELAREENQILAASTHADKEEEEEGGVDSTNQVAESSAANEEEEEDGEEEEEEEVSLLQIAWEVLELSRIIYNRQETPDSQMKLAKVKIKLGEVCMENEKSDEAIIHYQEAIQSFLAAGEPEDSREISSTYYMMGLAASLDQKFENAITHFTKCSQLMSSQISKQTDDEERASLTEMKTEVERMVTDCKDSLRQLHLYRKLMPPPCDSSSAATPLSGTLSGAAASASSSSASSSSAGASSSAAAGASSSSAGASSSSTGFSTPAFGSSSASSATSSAGASSVSNISHLVRKRPQSAVSQSAASQSATAAVSQSAPAGVSQSAYAAVSQSATAAVSQSAYAAVSQSATAAVSQSAYAAVSQSAYAAVSQSAYAAVSQSAYAAVSQSAYAAVSQSSASSTVNASPASSSSETTNRIAVKPMVRVTPIVSSSTSPDPETHTRTSAVQSSAVQSSAEQSSASQSSAVQSSEPTIRGSVTAAASSSAISSTNGIVRVVRENTSSREAQPATQPAPLPPHPNRQANGVSSSTTAAVTRVTVPSSTVTRVSVPSSTTGRQVATVSSVQRAEETISSSSDFKRRSGTEEDMNQNEAKRSRL